MVLIGCDDKSSVITQKVEIQTEDGLTLAGKVYSPPTNEKLPGVLLAHMYRNTHLSWDKYAKELASEGYIVLAFDFRHATEYEPDSMDIPNQYKDVLAAAEFLASFGRVDRDKIAAIGASMGGMASIIAAAHSSLIKGVVTITSPHSWKGAEPIEYVHKIAPRPLLVIAAKDDPHLTLRAAQIMYLKAGNPRDMVIIDTNRHGTDILATDKAEVLERNIRRFLKENFKPEELKADSISSSDTVKQHNSN